MTESTGINIVVAHAAEAKPLCAMFGLGAAPSNTPFPIFRNKEGLCLIVSGIGKLAAASATSYLAGMQADLPERAWLNAGIAGHQQTAVGAGLLAHKIRDAASGATYFPPQLIKGLPTTTVITVDKPESGYPEEAAYDMEAAGFYASASRLVTAELVHAYKIISDNPGQPLSHFAVAQVRPLIENQHSQLLHLLSELRQLLRRYHEAYLPSPAFTALAATYRLTASQQVQLKRLCERYHALGLQDSLAQIRDTQFGTSKQLLATLVAGLAHQVSA